MLNGQETEVDIQNGYLSLNREWSERDLVELELPMPVRRLICDEHVTLNRRHVAIDRGPLLYCLEEVAHTYPLYQQIAMSDDAELSLSYNDDLFGGIIVLKGEAASICCEKSNPTHAIPYCHNLNRGETEMLVTLPRFQN